MKNLSLLFFSSLFSVAVSAQTLSPLDVYDQTTKIVKDNFYDRTFRHQDWDVLSGEYRKKLSLQSTRKHLQQTVNDLLSHLQASHTEFITSDDQEYHGLQSIFSGDIEGDPYFQSGGIFQQIQGKWFVRNVLAGSPLEKSGLRSGDQIISVNHQNFEPVRSFLSSKSLKIKYRRDSGGTILSTEVKPLLKSIQELLLTATQSSARILSVGSKKIGYFHLWSGTHDRFLESLISTTEKMASSTDAMILDLRDGYGGAWTPYIQPFFNYDLETDKPISVIYSKPLYVLINDGVRSGKEYLAFVLKNKNRASLIGTTTAGHFLGGRFYEITKNQYSLYLAVADDFTGVIEGRGVDPDLEVPAPLPYSKGRDLQMEAALSMIRNQP